MKGLVSEFDLVAPETLTEAISLAGSMTPIAGGTDLMVLLESGHLAPGKFMSLAQVKELRSIEETSDVIRLGATVTFSEIRQHPIMQKEFPILVDAAAETGGIAIQNRGTIGGNIVNASPAADSPPGLLVYDATVVLQGPNGERRVAYDRFHLDYKKMDLLSGELLTAVEIPRRHDGERIHYFRKIGTRKAQAISKVVAAGVADVSGGSVANVKFAVGSVGPTVMRLRHVEKEMMQGSGAESIRRAVAASIKPLDDVRSTRQYRLAVAMNAAEEFAERMASR